MGWSSVVGFGDGLLSRLGREGDLFLLDVELGLALNVGSVDSHVDDVLMLVEIVAAPGVSLTHLRCVRVRGTLSVHDLGVQSLGFRHFDCFRCCEKRV